MVKRHLLVAQNADLPWWKSEHTEKSGRVLHEKFPGMHREGENRETAVNNGKAKGGFDESAHPLPS